MKTSKKSPDNKQSLSPLADAISEVACTVFELDENRYGLLASSLLHQSDRISRQDFGFKAMMKAISTLTARGGRSRNALVSFSRPASGNDSAPLILQGIAEAGKKAGADIARGEYFESDAAAVNIALFGDVEKKRFIRNTGTRPGDIIYLTGCTGDSLAGSEILMSGNAELLSRFPGLASRHAGPSARFDILQEIILLFSPGSMTHVTRGLAADLETLCVTGNTGCTIFEEKLPVSRELLEYSRLMSKNPSDYVLDSMDELELLFTSSKDLTETMNVLVNGIPVTAIGTVTANGFYLTANGEKTKLSGRSR